MAPTPKRQAARPRRPQPVADAEAPRPVEFIAVQQKRERMRARLRKSR